ncbi:ABC transporter permease [Duganella sp. S19_KUP01_CR8]|uniref:ABC transporter permease n=1 Tax=Duganella sp. S19_KUP01_CR8 TaxID=3025502 RepID=UPI002FCDDC52
MNALALKLLVLTEVRLRMRRTGTLVAVLALIAATWLMVGDPAKGQAMIVADNVRVAYTSSCLALGSAGLGGLFFGLAGFYLVRGRMSEDMRSGAGAVLAATPVSNAVFLLGRWLGGVAYLCGLLLIFMLTMLVLHLLRGQGPIQLLVYLQTFAMLLLPLLFFTAAMALLCDAWAPLMGRRGDVLYFIFYLAQLAGPIVLTADSNDAWSPLLLLDFSGMGATVLTVKAMLHTSNFAIGGGDFNPALPPVILPTWLWSAELGATRVGCALVALLPLLPAWRLFHRFAPDRVKVRASGGGRWSPLALANRLLRPLMRLVRPLFGLAARVPGTAGQALAVLALTLVSNPAAVAAALVLLIVGSVLPVAALGSVVIAAIAIWGVLVSDIGVRDHQHDVDAMSGTAPGGAVRRYGAQLLASCLLALLFTAPVLWRWTMAAPLRAAALSTGVLALAGVASLLGGLSRSARTFLALFLFGLYIATQATKVPVLDVVGFNGVATTQTVGVQLLLGLALAAGGLWHERWRSARN